MASTSISMKKVFFLLFCIFLFNSVFTQPHSHEEDKCGLPERGLKNSLSSLGDHWGYSYDSLLADLSLWEQSEFVTIESLGTSIQGRDIFELTISDFNISNNNKKRVYIHARTHPAEVQSFWVSNEIITLLLATSDLSTYLKENFIFHLVPMFNPDGVELEYGRENANGIDMESNWNASTVEKEVAVLRMRFNTLMLEDNPIEVALNMHSAYGNDRYFVCHHENGSSADYFDLEKYYISHVREYYPDGIQPYDHLITWTTGPTYRYPESWWWHNYGESVMALTYEDMNSSSAGFYDKTAYALLHGTSDYLDTDYTGTLSDYDVTDVEIKAWPNPFNDQVSIEWNDFKGFDKAQIIDFTGRVIREISIEETVNGRIIWNGKNTFGREVPGGVYLFQLIKGAQVKNIKLMKDE